VAFFRPSLALLSLSSDILPSLGPLRVTRRLFDPGMLVL
jgi:hypothetical protein